MLVSGFLLVGDMLVLVLPLALRANVEHNHVLQRRVIILNTEVHTVPHVAREHRSIIDDAQYEADGITHLHASFGFQDEPKVPAVLRQAVAQGFLADADLQELTYSLSHITIVGSPNASMPAWQTRLFLTIAHNAVNPAEYFGLPVERSISIGVQILSDARRFGGRPRGGRRRRRREGATPRGSLTARGTRRGPPTQSGQIGSRQPAGMPAQGQHACPTQPGLGPQAVDSRAAQ